MRAEALNSTDAFFTYRSPSSACIDSSYGSAMSRQYSAIAVSKYIR